MAILLAMGDTGPGHHGCAVFTASLTSKLLDAELIADAALELFGAWGEKPFRVRDTWCMAFVKNSGNGVWFAKAFGQEGDLAVFVAHWATGRDTAYGVGFERVK